MDIAYTSEEAKQGIVALILRVAEGIRRKLDKNGDTDFDKITVDMIDYLKAKASGVV